MDNTTGFISWAQTQAEVFPGTGHVYCRGFVKTLLSFVAWCLHTSAPALAAEYCLWSLGFLGSPTPVLPSPLGGQTLAAVALSRCPDFVEQSAQ